MIAMQDSTMLTSSKGISWLPGTVMLPWLIAGGVFLIALFLIIDKRRNPQTPLSTIIRTWPWQDTFLGAGVIASIVVVIYYMLYLIFCKPATMPIFKDAMEPLFDFLNIWLIGAGLTSVGRRAATKPEVINAQVAAGLDPNTGQMRVPPDAG